MRLPLKAPIEIYNTFPGEENDLFSMQILKTTVTLNSPYDLFRKLLYCICQENYFKVSLSRCYFYTTLLAFSIFMLEYLEILNTK